MEKNWWKTILFFFLEFQCSKEIIVDDEKKNENKMVKKNCTLRNNF